MTSINVILLMAGRSERFSSDENKLLYCLHHRPLFTYSLETFLSFLEISRIFIVISKNHEEKIKHIIEQNYDSNRITYVYGGISRAESVRNAVKLIDSDYVFIHDAARPLVTKEDIRNMIDKLSNYTCGTLYHKVFDTIKMVDKNKTSTINRDYLRAVSTPQFFSKQLYSTILHPVMDDCEITDELCLFENETIGFIEETKNNKKVTTKQDLEEVEYILDCKQVYKIGHSFDFHPLSEGRKLILGGIEIPYEKGLLGHSDADVVYHVVAESIMGALGIGDLGTLFPDTDIQFKNMSSDFFVKKVMEQVVEKGYKIQNMDIIIYLEKPNLKNYKVLMAKNIKQLTNCDYINVKATTLEKKGLIGNGFGIASEAVTLIKKDIQ